MATLDATNRARVAAQLQREPTLGDAAFTRAQLAAAVGAADDWVEANQAAFVAALPAAFRTSSTAAQKALLFTVVLMRRQGRYHAEED